MSTCKVINCTQDKGKVKQNGSSIKTAMKKALSLASSEDKDALNSALSKVYQLCDKAVVKGILHKNTAARKKSRLTLAIKKLAENK